MSFKSFDSKPQWISRKLGISGDEASQAMDLLERQGYFFRDEKGKCIVAEKQNLVLPTKETSAELKRYQRQVLTAGNFSPTTPTSGLCNPGTAGVVSTDGNGGYFWTCSNGNPAQNVTCNTMDPAGPGCTSDSPTYCGTNGGSPFCCANTCTGGPNNWTCSN